MNNLIVVIWTENTQAQNATMDIGECMLCQAASVAASGPFVFQSRPETVEYLLCARYCWKNIDINLTPQNGAVVDYSFLGTATSATNIFIELKYEVRMRTEPTCTSYRSSNGAADGYWSWFNGATYTDGSATNFSSASTQEQGMRLALTTTGRTFGQSFITKGVIIADAEL